MLFFKYVNVCKNIHGMKKNAWFTSDDNDNRLYSKSDMVFQKKNSNKKLNKSALAVFYKIRLFTPIMQYIFLDHLFTREIVSFH